MAQHETPSSCGAIGSVSDSKVSDTYLTFCANSIRSFLDSSGKMIHFSNKKLFISQNTHARSVKIDGSMCTVKILKFGTPQTIAIIVLKLVKFDVTMHECIQKKLMQWQTA